MPSDQITIDRTFQAPIAQVWQAWTDPAIILQWFGSDPKGKGIAASLDPKPGGSFEITFQNSDGTPFTCGGKYLEVQQPNKLVFTWSWTNEPDTISQVTVLLSPENNHTRQHFKHKGFGHTSSHQYQEGWQRTFEKLEKILTQPR
jgi:uncharacterized protein YndB with AHSA1/START domain